MSNFRRRESGMTLLELIVALGIISVIAAISVPSFGNSMAYLRVSGDARSLSNALALSKMRAASHFSRVRLFVDLDSNAHHIETWDKDASEWQSEGGTTYLSSGVAFGFGDDVDEAPPDTQATIAQAEACTDDDGDPIGNTACVMFNSRGVPIDSSFAPTGADALYLTDGEAVYGVTIAATGMMRNWKTKATEASWMLQ